jgi:outer membrane protein assembly factor BamB
LFGAALLFLLLLTSCGAPPPGDSWPGISTDGKYVYVAFKEHILRIDPVVNAPEGQKPTFRLIDWLAEVPNKAPAYGPPAVDAEGNTYVGTYDHKVYAFDASGKPLPGWSTPTFADKIIGGAFVKDDLLYVPMGDKGVRALDRKTGVERWAFTNTRYGVWATPQIVDNTLYAASLDHHVYALDAKTGEPLWQVNLNGAIGGAPLFDNGTLYVGTFANELSAISVTERKVVNTFRTEGWVWGTPIIKEGILYFGDLKGWVYALDLKGWQLKWKVQDTEHPGAVRGRLALTQRKETVDGKEVVKDMIIAGSESKFLRAYDAASGQVLWTSAIATEERILSDLIVIGDDIIFTTLSPSQIVAAFSVQTGRLNWRVSLPDQGQWHQTLTARPPITATPTQPTAASTAAPTVAPTVAPTAAATAAQ